MSAPDVKNVGWRGIGVLLLVNLIVLSFFFSPGTGDIGAWARWMREIDANGLIGGYAQSDADYPPLSFVILGIVTRSAAAFEVSRFVVLKISLFVFLVASATCFYWATRDLILTAALELALTLNSIGLAYLDIYFAPFLIAGFFLLQRGHLSLGLLLVTISCSIKWQPLIIAPFVFLYVFAGEKPPPDKKSDLLKRFIPFAISAAVAFVLLLIFGAKIFDSLRRSMTGHNFLSANALNFSWLQTWLAEVINPDKYGALQNGEIRIFVTSEPLLIWPDKILFYFTYLAVLIGFARGSKNFQQLVIYSLLGYLAYFCFNTGVHENHLFLVCCLAWMLVFLEPDQLSRGINFSLAANANLFLFYGVFGDRLQRVFAGVDITPLFAIANLCLFGGLLWQTFKKDGLDLWLVKVEPWPKEIA